MFSYGINSEYKSLECVMLFCPGSWIESMDSAEKWLFQNHRISHSRLKAEYDAIKRAFEELCVQVLMIEDSRATRGQFNMMFCRDQLFMTPGGAIISRMFPKVRRDEPRLVEVFLRKNDIPVLRTIQAPATVEGADCLWLSKHEVIVGVGGRTDKRGQEQVRHALARCGIECIAAPFAQRKTQHLLGVLQIVDAKRALIRHEIIDPAAIRLLEDRGIEIIRVPENEEVKHRQAMNIVTVAPNAIMMPSGCPETQKIYEDAGITVKATLEVVEMIKGSGGLACATAIVSRER